MNEHTKRAAMELGIVVVEHEVATSWSDDRTPYAYRTSHSVDVVCDVCRQVALQMKALAELSGGER